MPKYAVISVGKNNAYGHPSEEILSRLRDAGAKVYRTDIHGDIICTSDGHSISFITEKIGWATRIIIRRNTYNKALIDFLTKLPYARIE